MIMIILVSSISDRGKDMLFETVPPLPAFKPVTAQ